MRSPPWPIIALDHGVSLPTSFSRHVLGSFSSVARDAADFIHGATVCAIADALLSGSLGSLTLSPLSQPGCIKRPTNDLARGPFLGSSTEQRIAAVVVVLKTKSIAIAQRNAALQASLFP